MREGCEVNVKKGKDLEGFGFAPPRQARGVRRILCTECGTLCGAGAPVFLSIPDLGRPRSATLRKPCGEPGAPASALSSGGGETFQGSRSVKQVEGVCGVVDEIDAIADCDEAEERTGPGRRASAVVDELDGDLLVDLRVDLDDVSVVSVCDQDVMVIGCNARPSGLLSVPP